MSQAMKDFFAGIELQDGEEYAEAAMAELSDNRGEDDEEAEA